MDCPDYAFATIVTLAGNVQIGDTIYAYGLPGDQAAAVPAMYSEQLAGGDDVSSLDGVRNFGTAMRAPFVRHYQDEDGVIGVITSEICINPTRFSNWWGQLEHHLYKDDNDNELPKHNNRPVRLTYSRWRTSYGIYTSIGVRLKMYKKTQFAGWSSVTNANYMMLEACCSGQVNYSNNPSVIFNNEQTSPAWPNLIEYGVNSMSKTLKFSAGFGNFFPDIVLTKLNVHFKVDYRGAIIERMVRDSN